MSMVTFLSWFLPANLKPLRVTVFSLLPRSGYRFLVFDTPFRVVVDIPPICERLSYLDDWFTNFLAI